MSQRQIKTVISYFYEITVGLCQGNFGTVKLVAYAGASDDPLK